MWDGMAGIMDLIWGSREGIYFFAQDWTGGITLIPRENFFSGVIPEIARNGDPEGMTLLSTVFVRSPIILVLNNFVGSIAR